jgi:hypothetical protein
MRSFLSAWVVVVGASWALSLAGCASDPRPRVLTEPCASTDECESRLSCIAGRCTIPCAADSYCVGLEPVDLFGWPASCYEGFCEIVCDPAPTERRCPLLSECVTTSSVASYCKPSP